MGAFITAEWKARKVRNPLQDTEIKMPDAMCKRQFAKDLLVHDAMIYFGSISVMKKLWRVCCIQSYIVVR